MNWLGRFLYQLLKFIGPIVPFWRKERVRLVLINDYQEVLLVKTWLSRQLWALPGGGINRGESPLQAVIRETFEETGYKIESHQLHELRRITRNEMGFVYTVFAAHIRGRDLPRLQIPYTREIISRAWIPISDMPEDVTSYTKVGIELALEHKK